MPPPIWALALLGVTYLASFAPGFRDFPAYQNVPLGIGLFLLGAVFPIAAAVQFARAGTQITPTSPVNNKLVVDGVFGLTRNPMYLGLIVITLGIAIGIGRPLMYLTPILIFAIENWVHIPFEEAKMRRQFGAEFDAYTQRVRRWI